MFGAKSTAFADGKRMHCFIPFGHGLSCKLDWSRPWLDALVGFSPTAGAGRPLKGVIINMRLVWLIRDAMIYTHGI
jgi:hypothetical protein